LKILQPGTEDLSNTGYHLQYIFKLPHKISRMYSLLQYNIPSQVECLQYNNRPHMTQFCINVSFIYDRAHGTGLIILSLKNSSYTLT